MQVFADVLTSAHAWNSEEPLLIYSVPPDMQHELQTGQLIAVPYGDRLVEGIVWQIWEEDGDNTRHPISGHPQGAQSLGETACSLHLTASHQRVTKM